jgi:hypothetical protein
MAKEKGYPAYQCFKMKSRDVYCSKDEVSGHAKGSEWVTAAITHHGLKAGDMLGKPYTSDDQPKGATIYPA